MISYFTIMAMVFPNQLRVGSCGVSIGPTHSISQSPYKRFKAGSGSLRLGLFGCWRASTCMQNDEITKLTCYMVGIPFPEGAQPMMNSIQLAACGANELLPSCPELPADIFTSCLLLPSTLPSDISSSIINYRTKLQQTWWCNYPVT